MALKEYDPGQVQLSFFGVIVTGFADGTMITVERDEKTWTKKVGADGEVARTRVRNSSGKITFTLMSTSSSNAELAALIIIDEFSGAGVGPALVKDNSGIDLHAAAEAWLSGPPPAEYGDESSDREYELDCADLDMFSGGN